MKRLLSVIILSVFLASLYALDFTEPGSINAFIQAGGEADIVLEQGMTALELAAVQSSDMQGLQSLAARSKDPGSAMALAVISSNARLKIIFKVAGFPASNASALDKLQAFRSAGISLNALLEIPDIGWSLDLLDLACMGDDVSLIDYLLDNGAQDQGLDCQLFSIFSSSPSVVDRALEISNDSLGLMPFLSLLEVDKLSIAFLEALVSNELGFVLDLGELLPSLDRFELFGKVMAKGGDPMAYLDLSSLGIEGRVSLLMLAIAMQNSRAVEYLIDNGANAAFQGPYGITPLAIACLLDGDVQNLLEHGAIADGYCAMASIVSLPGWVVDVVLQEIGLDSELGDLGLERSGSRSLEAILDAGVDPDFLVPTESGPVSLLGLSILLGNEDAAQLLISRGADVNEACLLDLKPMELCALIGGNGSILSSLASSGAFADETCLDYYFNGDLSQVLEYIGFSSSIYQGKAWDIEGLYSILMASDSESPYVYVYSDIYEGLVDPLTYCCFMNITDLAKDLINAGWDVNSRNEDGISPLMAAAFASPDGKTVKALLRASANMEARDLDGYTAVMYAAYNPSITALGILESRGANLKAISDNDYDLIDIIESVNPELVGTKLYWELRDKVRY